MKFTDNMSVPLWKIGLLQKRQRKKEEEKRKEREAEEERLRKLPPWKRQAEQPKTVIIIDKNKTPNPVDLAELSKQANPSSKSSAKQTPGPLVNGTAHVQKVDSGESAGNRGKAGRDEADNGAGAGGVSEEHCPPVHQNVFLTLERKKRKAPPPPKGSQISVIASNVPVVTNDPLKSANSSKKTLPSEPTNSANNKKTVTTGSESVKVKHIQQSKELNGPSVIGNKTQSSTTKPLSSDDIIDKKNLKEDVPKSKTKDSAPSIKVGNIEHVSTTNSKTKPSSSSAASSSKETISSQISKKEEPKQPSGSITEIHKVSGRRAQGRKKSISELSSLFGGAITPSNNPKSPPPSRSAQSGPSEKVKSQKTSSDTKPASTASSPSKPSNSTSSTKTVVSTRGQSVKREDSPKPDESKKIVKSSTTKSESKSLPAAAKSPSPSRNKPSQDLPASEIISLTNEGPLKNRKGQLVRPSSVIDDETEVTTISLESPRSPQKNRLLKAQGLADSGDDASSAGTAKVSNGSPEKRKAPSAPQPGKVNDGSSNETKTKDTNSTVSKEDISGSTKPSSTSINKVEDKKVDYPRNFRDPNYVPKKEEVAKTEDTSKKEKIPYPAEFRKPVVADSTSNISQDPVKPAPSKVSVEDSKKEPVVKTVNVSKKLDQTSSDATVSATDKKVSEQKKVPVKTKESPVKPTAESHIPYPDDFRKPKQQPTSNKSKDIKKDIVKPSDLHSEPPTAQKKDDNDNVTSGNIFGKLRKIKKPAQTGISVIQVGNDSSKPTVDNSPKAPPSGLLNVGGGGGTSTGKKKNVVKKFEKVEFIGYNSPTGKASALKAEGKSTKKGMNISFSSKEEEMFEYMSEDASAVYYDQTHQGAEEEDGGKKSPLKAQAKAKVENGMKNGTMDNSHDDDDDDDGEASLKSNAPIRSSGGFQNLAASNLSAMDMLLGRGPRPSEPKEPPKPAPPQEQVEPEPEYPKPMDADFFSSAGTAALLF
ncbi:nucleolar protein dao-5 [Strongylocentrotus purpuratus]|uniref:Uncharacterized protein n=1 Tax=Strongylocentrotus purpuratus TaxID=7668 RepID=A0A7M7PPK4_STRPU|nr:nucleolar protein dao-5 [Strongylocentrotus purpuratus]